MLIEEIINEQDIDFYNRKGSKRPDYMIKGNPGIGSMSNDELDALIKPFTDKYNKSLDAPILDPKSDFWIDNDEVWQDLQTYQQGKLKGDKFWRQKLPARQYDLKYNMDDPREPRLNKPSNKDAQGMGKIKRPSKEPV